MKTKTHPMGAGLLLPKHHQIYQDLREQVLEGRFHGGLPSEKVLSQRFGAARVTVRRALERLASEGLIVREPGRGTRPARIEAAPHRRAAATAPLRGLLEDVRQASLRTRVKVLEVAAEPAAPEVADALRLPRGTVVQKAVRLRSSRQGPLSCITTYVPLALAQGFGREELMARPILTLLEEAGARLGRTLQTLSARQADAHVARALAVPVGTALLAVERLVLDLDERPVQWLCGLYLPERYEYRMEISQMGALDARISIREALEP